MSKNKTQKKRVGKTHPKTLFVVWQGEGDDRYMQCETKLNDAIRLASDDKELVATYELVVVEKPIVKLELESI